MRRLHHASFLQSSRYAELLTMQGLVSCSKLTNSNQPKTTETSTSTRPTWRTNKSERSFRTNDQFDIKSQMNLLFSNKSIGGMQLKQTIVSVQR